MSESTKHFSTGAVRSSDAEATRYDLISPIALEALARTCAEGASRYGDFNWEKGMPAHDLLNHAIRHIYLFLGGDRSEDHLPHAMWGVAAAIHSLALWPDLNNGTLRSTGCGVPIHNEIRGVNSIKEVIGRAPGDWYERHGTTPEEVEAKRIKPPPKYKVSNPVNNPPPYTVEEFKRDVDSKRWGISKTGGTNDEWPDSDGPVFRDTRD